MRKGPLGPLCLNLAEREGLLGAARLALRAVACGDVRVPLRVTRRTTILYSSGSNPDTSGARRAKGAKRAPLRKSGGEGGIRTLGTRESTTVFETAPFDHSGTSPNWITARGRAATAERILADSEAAAVARQGIRRVTFQPLSARWYWKRSCRRPARPCQNSNSSGCRR